MVESSRAKINFIKLNSQELSSKIALVVSNSNRVIFWKITPRYFEGHATAFSIKNKKIFLTIERVGIHVRLNNEIVCLNFSLHDIDYFLRGRVVEQLEDNPHLTIELEEYCFRVEKRSRERLLTYPVYSVYAYLKYKKASKNNVISINKSEQKTKDFFSEIDNLQKRKITEMAEGLSIDNDEDLVGFRVEDLSSTGLSFLASTKEKELILDPLKTEAFNLVLNFEMKFINLEEAVFVYKMNYINAQFAGMSMHKIGINFKHNSILKKIIEDMSGMSIDLADYQKEFEEYIKNE